MQSLIKALWNKGFLNVYYLTNRDQGQYTMGYRYQKARVQNAGIKKSCATFD